MKLRWAGLVTTTIAWDEELLDLAARSGCRGLLIGFESLDQKALDETRKSFNMRQDYHLVVDRMHDRGIAIMGCFVFGFDDDTLETFDRPSISSWNRAWTCRATPSRCPFLRPACSGASKRRTAF